MSKRFTIAQYQYIVAQQEEYFPDNVVSIGISNRTLNDVYLSLDKKFNSVISGKIEDAKNKFLALFNPVTRELVYNKFVEKEKKYYWTTKKLDKYGVRGRLYKTTDDTIKPYFDAILNDTDEQLTEAEVKEWGYNPDMFDKEEVK